MGNGCPGLLLPTGQHLSFLSLLTFSVPAQSLSAPAAVDAIFCLLAPPGGRQLPGPKLKPLAAQSQSLGSHGGFNFLKCKNRPFIKLKPSISGYKAARSPPLPLLAANSLPVSPSSGAPGSCQDPHLTSAPWVRQYETPRLLGPPLPRVCRSNAAMSSQFHAAELTGNVIVNSALQAYSAQNPCG